MARLVQEEAGKLQSLTCQERTFSQLKAGASSLAQEILRLIAEQPMYSHEIAKALKVHEQKIYYHVRKLEQAGLIIEARRQEMQGASAKYYKLAAPSFAVRLKEPVATEKITAMSEPEASFLAPFIKEGRASFRIIVGSPEVHGPNMAQAKDGSYAIDLALFLGSFLSERAAPVVKLDTECQEEDLRENLIIIGGPIVNTIAARVNDELPIRFEQDGKSLHSTLSGEQYANDQIGLIVKAPNPFAAGRSILLIAGRSKPGTKAAIIAFLKHFEELIATQKVARVVEGRDLDSDGVVDEVEFKE